MNDCDVDAGGYDEILEIKILGQVIGETTRGWDLMDTFIVFFYEVKIEPIWLNRFDSNINWNLYRRRGEAFRFDLQLDYVNGIMEIFKPNQESVITTVNLDLLGSLRSQS